MGCLARRQMSAYVCSTSSNRFKSRVFADSEHNVEHRRFVGLELTDMKRLRTLKGENAKLKPILAEDLEIDRWTA